MRLYNFVRVATPTFILLTLSLSFKILSAHAAEPEEKVYFLLTDHLGSVDVVTDIEGNVVEQRDYLPFGSERLSVQNPDSTETDYGYTGKELDEETGLNYYGARYYDSHLGRFTSPDPWEGDLTDPQTFNKYVYVNNNPVRYVDPTGAELKDFFLSPSSNSSYSYGESFGSYKATTLTSGGEFTGRDVSDYQCTSLAKDFALDQYNVNLNYTGHGYDYGDQSQINRAFADNGNDLSAGSYVVHSNGGYSMPQEDDLISWSGGPHGHVGVIAEVVFDESSGNGTIYSLEQNFSRNQALFTQAFTRSYDENGQAIYNVEGRDGYNVLGWARYGNQSTAETYTPIPHSPNTSPAPMSYDTGANDVDRVFGN